MELRAVRVEVLVPVVRTDFAVVGKREGEH